MTHRDATDAELELDRECERVRDTLCRYYDEGIQLYHPTLSVPGDIVLTVWLAIEPGGSVAAAVRRTLETLLENLKGTV